MKDFIKQRPSQQPGLDSTTILQGLPWTDMRIMSATSVSNIRYIRNFHEYFFILCLTSMFLLQQVRRRTTEERRDVKNKPPRQMITTPQNLYVVPVPMYLGLR